MKAGAVPSVECFRTSLKPAYPNVALPCEHAGYVVPLLGCVFLATLRLAAAYTAGRVELVGISRSVWSELAA